MGYDLDNSHENEGNPANNSSNDPKQLHDDQGYGSGDDNSTESSDFDPKNSDYPFLEDSLSTKLEIPLTENEKKLISDFHKEIEGVKKKPIFDFHKKIEGVKKITVTESTLQDIERITDKYLERGIRLNSCLSNNHETITNLIFEEIKGVLESTTNTTFGGIASRFDPTDFPDYSKDKAIKDKDKVTKDEDEAIKDKDKVTKDEDEAIKDEDEATKDENIIIIQNIVRNLLLRGGKVKRHLFYHDRIAQSTAAFKDDHKNPVEQVVQLEQFDDHLSKECKEFESKLKSIANEGIVNKSTQTQDELEVEIDNKCVYMKYPQDSIIEPVKIFNKAEALKDKALDLKVGIIQIGESIVRVEATEDKKRNYTDILEGSIQMSFTTEVGEISIYLHPSEKDSDKIEVEIDEENKARLNKLKAEKKSLGENCLLGGKSVLEAIKDKGFKRNPTETTKDDPLTDFTQVRLQQKEKTVVVGGLK